MLCFAALWDATATKSRTPHPEKQWANQPNRARYLLRVRTRLASAPCWRPRDVKPQTSSPARAAAVRLHRSGLPRVWLPHNTGPDF